MTLWAERNEVEKIGTVPIFFFFKMETGPFIKQWKNKCHCERSLAIL